MSDEVESCRDGMLEMLLDGWIQVVLENGLFMVLVL